MDTKIEIKKAGFILKPDSPEIKPIYQKVRDSFESKGIEVIIAEKSADMIDEEGGIDFNKMCDISDILVSLGGDGTLLSLVRRSYKWHKPILGINAGNLGFLADIVLDEIDTFIN